MRQILFATTNKGKVADINLTLQKYGIEAIQAELDLPEPRADDVEPIGLFLHFKRFRGLVLLLMEASMCTN